jgi:hypothetical protein
MSRLDITPFDRILTRMKYDLSRLSCQEQRVARMGHCIWQIWSGIQQKAKGREIAGPLGWTGYCGKKATHGHHCAEHDAEARGTPWPDGLVLQRKARSTGTLVGLYKSDDAGIESDPEYPWSTVCEPHGGVVCHETRKAAEAALSHPEDWCPTCQEGGDGTEGQDRKSYTDEQDRQSYTVNVKG